MRTIIKNIECLVTCSGSRRKKGKDMGDAAILNEGYVVVDNDRIVAVGSGDGYKNYYSEGDKILDGKGKTVTPGLVDSHTHVVYGGSREFELPLKLKKMSYIDILESGGGILSTVEETRKCSMEKLVTETRKRLDAMLLHGTTTIESKSGYGLNFGDEVRMLEVNKVLNDTHYIDIISTYLGAHAIPNEYLNDREGYMDLMIKQVIPYVADRGLADFIDCFCEIGVFSVEESRKVLEEGKRHGLKVKIHADEIEAMGGSELAGELKATSAEHLVAANESGINALAKNEVIAVLLPTTSFYLMLDKYAPAREMIENGVPVALATDCNPGTSPTESLQNVMTYACFGLRMLPEEIINAVTINAACAVGRENEIGSIEVGKKADMVMFEAKNLNYLIYHFGVNAVDKVIKNGKVVVENGKIMR